MNRVKERRVELGLSQAKLAELLEVTVKTICNIEQQKTPNLCTALRLAEYLSTTVDQLFKFETDYTFIVPTNTLADNILRLGEYLVYTYGDLGNPHTVEGLSNYPDCTAKFDLANLQGFDLTLL